MDEQVNPVVYTPPQDTKPPRKPIRHMIWAVCLIALVLMLLGQIVGEIFTGLLAGLLGITDGATLFLFMYLSFIGIDLLVLLYTLLCEKPILRSLPAAGPAAAAATPGSSSGSVCWSASG